MRILGYERTSQEKSFVTKPGKKGQGSTTYAINGRKMPTGNVKFIKPEKPPKQTNKLQVRMKE